MTKSISLVLADDQVTVRTSLRMRLALEVDLLVVGEAHDGTEAIKQAHQLQPDVVLLDVRMPHVDGITAAAIIHRQNPAAVIIMLSFYDDANTRKRALSAGASAFFGKHEPVEELLVIIRQIKGAGTPH